MKEETASNQEKALNPEQNKQRAKEIVSLLVGSNRNEALAILSASMYIIASGEPLSKNILDNSGHWGNPNLIRCRRGGVSPIDVDQEVKAYILGIDRYLSISQLHDALIKKFGGKRAPSKSAIHRFLQRVNQANR